MRLVKPSVEIIDQEPGMEGLLKHVELCGRVAYKSEDKITEGSAKKFVDILIKSGHTSVLEHGSVCICSNKGDYSYDEKSLQFLKGNPYVKEVKNVVYCYEKGMFTEEIYYSTNYRVIIENRDFFKKQSLFKKQSDLKLIYEPADTFERRVTVKFVCSRAIANEIVRHRKLSFTQESTRYCNYTKDKFNKSITYILPVKLFDKNIPLDVDIIDTGSEMTSWEVKRFIAGDNDSITRELYLYLSSLYRAEITYERLVTLRQWKPEEARGILPLDLKTEIIVSGFVSDWEDFFNLRCAKNAHPDIQYLACELQQMFKDRKYLTIRPDDID